jgi:hypothetical protein
MRLFEYDKRSLLASIPEMYAFRKVTGYLSSPSGFYVILTFAPSQLSDTYTVWQHKAEQAGNVTFLLCHTVTRVVSRTKKRTILEFRIPPSDELRTAEFDSLILATDAESALTILAKEATWMERHVLGGVKYLHDLTVTHMDTGYMRKVASVSVLLTRPNAF